MHKSSLISLNAGDDPIELGNSGLRIEKRDHGMLLRSSRLKTIQEKLLLNAGRVSSVPMEEAGSGPFHGVPLSLKIHMSRSSGAKGQQTNQGLEQ